MKKTTDGALPKNGITIEEAENWTKNWQSQNPNLSKAFLIPNSDILSLLEEIGVIVNDGNGVLTVHSNPAVYGIRAYLGIGKNATTGKDEEKLVMVGTVDVKGEYQDQVENSKDKPKVALSGSGAFDFARPCPVYCNVNSSLYHN